MNGYDYRNSQDRTTEGEAVCGSGLNFVDACFHGWASELRHLGANQALSASSYFLAKASRQTNGCWDDGRWRCIGGLAGGKKGAAIGSLVGAGSGALYTYKIRKRHRHRRY